jgi:hypothetical protein
MVVGRRRSYVFGGLDSPGGPQNPFQNGGGTPHFEKMCWAAGAAPNPPNRRCPVGPKTMHSKPSCVFMCIYMYIFVLGPGVHPGPLQPPSPGRSRRLHSSFSGPDIVDFWGLNSSVPPQNPSGKGGGLPPTFSNGSVVAWGCLDHTNRRSQARKHYESNLEYGFFRRGGSAAGLGRGAGSGGRFPQPSWAAGPGVFERLVATLESVSAGAAHSTWRIDLLVISSAGFDFKTLPYLTFRFILLAFVQFWSIRELFGILRDLVSDPSGFVGE